MSKTIKNIQDNCTECPVPQNVRDELCPICATRQIIHGKWKLLIVWSLRRGKMRFSHLQAAIPSVKAGPLAAHLKDLIQDGLVDRISFNEVPPHVEYSLTKKGMDYVGILECMNEWAHRYMYQDS